MVIVEFKDKLRKLRTEAGLSQEALAEIIHISRSAIAKLKPLCACEWKHYLIITSKT